MFVSNIKKSITTKWPWTVSKRNHKMKFMASSNQYMIEMEIKQWILWASYLKLWWVIENDALNLKTQFFSLTDLSLLSWSTPSKTEYCDFKLLEKNENKRNSIMTIKKTIATSILVMNRWNNSFSQIKEKHLQCGGLELFQ